MENLPKNRMIRKISYLLILGKISVLSGKINRTSEPEIFKTLPTSIKGRFLEYPANVRMPAPIQMVDEYMTIAFLMPIISDITPPKKNIFQ